ncbi:MAG: hypothetical protein RX318_05090 [bacterium]|nr:hypothetical protein [bacterium]
MSDIDIARFVNQGYQAEAGEKPIAVEEWIDRDNTPRHDFYGMVNPCRYGDQAGGHAVYCGSPSPKAPRKCHFSWYTGGENSDWACPLFVLSPLWQEVGDDFYENRELTIEIAKRLGLVGKIEDIDI